MTNSNEIQNLNPTLYEISSNRSKSCIKSWVIIQLLYIKYKCQIPKSSDLNKYKTGRNL